MDKRCDIFDPSRVGDRSDTPDGAGMDVGSTVHQEWEFVGHRSRSCHVEQSRVSGKLVGIIEKTWCGQHGQDANSCK